MLDKLEEIGMWFIGYALVFVYSLVTLAYICATMGSVITILYGFYMLATAFTSAVIMMTLGKGIYLLFLGGLAFSGFFLFSIELLKTWKDFKDKMTGKKGFETI